MSESPSAEHEIVTDSAGDQPGRFAEEGDWLARQFFSSEDLALSREEYAARNAHRWGCFSLHLHPFRDQALGNWVRQLGHILFTDGETERCRQMYLTPEESAAVRKEEQEGF